MTYYQQGDTLYFPENVPSGVKELKTNIVQEGEHTGHAHRLQGDGFVLYQKDRTKYLRVLTATPLTHEEHEEIVLPPGTYRTAIVREYDHFDEEAREVLD